MVSSSTSRTPTFIQLTTNNGPLAQIWLASNMSHSLSKSVSQHTDIIKSVEEIARIAGCSLDSANVESITLRASGELLHGVVRVYSKKTSLLLNDIKDTLTRMTSLFRSSPHTLTLQLEQTTITNPSQYLLQDAVTEREVLQVPGLEFLNEVSIPRGFMDHERSMERHVQGAAPWDSSIEVGRNVRTNNELGYNHSSVLDLDFDIDDTETKAVGEGTNTTINKSTQTTGSALIQEDDFPADDQFDWDLGIRDQSVNPGSDHESDRSMELGRRVAMDESQQDHTEFDFDLGLGKDPEDAAVGAGAQDEEMPDPVSSPPLPEQHEVDLSRLRKLTTDSDTELRDELVKVSQLGPDSHIIVQQYDVPHLQAKPNKRLWTQIADKVDYLPESILNNLLAYKRIKKPRTATEISQVIEEEPQLDVSLGFDDDLVTSLDNDHDIREEVELADPWEHDEDHNLELEAEIANGTSASIDMDGNSSLETESGSQQKPSTNVRLVTGEYISRGTTEMAAELKTQFLDVDPIPFSRCLESRTNASQLTDGPTKKQASKTFFELLSLANMDCIDLNQEANFGDIEIKSRASLYSKFIVA
ncbi:LANO_0C03422g1_1 [Lachancea nothofagi CBS 11611]|uniref:LANO_0C03422g1_1 n=1 Tax=Lachancea nothofagi CBS 11611 TaxID=1266666 RepID=A0A1G4J6E3_9SACH|nr:LANO_0C03422g1_1 [Lachancea nothofagi CBS 11611]